MQEVFTKFLLLASSSYLNFTGRIIFFSLEVAFSQGKLSISNHRELIILNFVDFDYFEIGSFDLECVFLFIVRER